MFLQDKICVSAHVGKLFAKCLSELSVLKILVEKMISLVIFDTDHSLKAIENNNDLLREEKTIG